MLLQLVFEEIFFLVTLDNLENLGNRKKTLFGLKIRQDSSIWPKTFCKFYIKPNLSVFFSILFVVFGTDLAELSLSKKGIF